MEKKLHAACIGFASVRANICHVDVRFTEIRTSKGFGLRCNELTEGDPATTSAAVMISAESNLMDPRLRFFRLVPC